ncbi:MAG: hypothetical protein ABIJ56_00200 [Pseudomonadota bacterium]
MAQQKKPDEPFEPCCLPTTIGSMPHRDVAWATDLMLAATPEIPSWVQFPHISPAENMMVQFTEGLPGIVLKQDKAFFDTSADDFVERLTVFFTHYLAVTGEGSGEALEHFAISRPFAAGFWELVEKLPWLEGVVMPKGQVTGPVTLGLNIMDQEGRCSYYDERLRDVIVKIVAMKAMWQIRFLKAGGPRVMMFLDEPSLLGFGSHMLITISREDVIRDINEVVAAIHGEGGISGVHCEENTDWSILMQTDLDILDFDAYEHLQSIMLYPDELLAFFKRGGVLGWGIVPTLNPEAAQKETLESLLDRFEGGIDSLAAMGINRGLLLRRALITPSCGMGGVLTEPLAERVLNLLRELSDAVRRRYAFE